MPEIGDNFYCRAPILAADGRMLGWLDCVRSEYYLSVERRWRAAPFAMANFGLVLLALVFVQRRAAREREIAQRLDITATAMEVAGLSAEKAVDGVNLLPHLRGEASGDPHAALLWRFWGQTGVRAGDWKLVRLDNGATEMLYHLGEDLGEKSNRLESEPKKAAELRALLKKWESEMMPAKHRGGLNVQEKEWFREHAGVN